MESPSRPDVGRESEPRREFDWHPDPGPSNAVVEAVAGLTGDDVTAMTPLYEAIDGESLDRVCRRLRDSLSDVAGHVSFDYDGYRVVVTSDGRGFVYDQAEPSEA